ncbi:VWA domain-containing protein [uncultured Faecalibaculum sp.]|uniref:DUF7604 domain-containing protein n=1 Tax=uncultured Faecalibaculum sp. TaxID=1729681 RepID=UPI00267680ED|nr:VWA domain-containing protein [uncultured Faecalibaculum sp.]
MMKGKGHRHIRRKLVGALAALVVFCTTYALILPAVTLSTEAHCGKEEHTHTSDCYQSDEYLCGQEESAGSEGHVHDETCYQDVQTLICGLEENEFHTHDDSCYQTEQVLICDKEESEAVEGHTHTADCKKSDEPICGKEEHTHSRQCESDPDAVETEEDWKKSLPQDLKEDVRERILQVAESQLGYRESEKNFRVNEDKTEDGFTRYGEWVGDRYGDWNNAFTGWVLNYGEADAGFNKNLNQWIADQAENLKTELENAKPGDVVFYLDDEGQRKSGILDHFDQNSQKARIYAGNVDKSVKKIDRTAAQMIGTLESSERDAVETETDSTDMDETSDDPDSDEREKTVVVEGADVRVQSGDEITLTAVPKGFENAEMLRYQWQYNDTENADSSAWKDLDGETGQKLTIVVSDDNLAYHWRVGIVQETQEVSAGGTSSVDGVAYKLKPVMPVRNLEETLTDSESPAPEETETIYSGEVMLQTEEVVSEEAVADSELQPSTFTIEKKWTKQPLESEVQTVPVSIRYGDYNPDTCQPDLLEGMEDPNPVIMTTDISYDSASRTWKKEISYDNLLREFKSKFPNQTADYTKFYVTENLDGYLATYERNENVDNGFITLKATPADQLENGKKYVILNDVGDKALGSSGSSINATDYRGKVSSESIVWTAEAANGGNFYLKRNNGYLRISSGSLTTNKSQENAGKFAVINNGVLKSGNYYIDYGSSEWWQDKAFRADSTQYRAKIYEIVQGKLDIQYTITNTKVASGSFGSGTVPIAAKEIPHSKTIDYLGDSAVNADAGYGAGKDLSDSYRLYLDAGPIADENPVNLILVLDTSSSMGNKLGTTNKTRWDSLKDTLVGSSGILSDFFKLNPTNQVRLITFASRATVDQDVYGSFDSIRSKLNNTSLQSGKLGGTNYEDALLKLSGVIDETPRGYSTYVIFLSDGVPTVHNSGNSYEIGGNQHTNMDDAEGTVKQINALYADATRQFTLSTIAYDTSPSVFLAKNPNGVGTFTYGSKSLAVPDLPSKDGFCGSASNVVGLQEQLYLMCIGPRCDNLTIRDTLSENVDFDLQNTNIIVKAIPTATNGAESEAVTIYKVSSLAGKTIDPNQPLSNEAANFRFVNRDTIGTNVDVKNWTTDQVFGNSGGVFVDTQKKTIELKFNPNWSMDPMYRYEISFNVETTAKAYENFEKQNLVYVINGDLNSDYKPTGNITSSNRGGFWSNKNSSLVYRYKNPYQESETEWLSTNPGNNQTEITAYQRPVVQTDAALLDLYKVSKDGSNKLNGAVFEIYDDLSKDPLKEYTTSGSGDLAGHIEIGRVTNGKTYYIKEKIPPAGYLQDNVIFKIEFNGKDTKVTVLDGNGEPGDFNPDDYISIAVNGRHVTLTVQNEAGKPLPNTGGSGTQLLTSAGGAMIAGSLLMYGYRKRLRGKERRSK